MAIRPLNLKNQVKTLKIYQIKWSDVFHNKNLADRKLTASSFFLEKRAIPPCFFKQAFFIANTKGRHALLFIKIFFIRVFHVTHPAQNPNPT
ncbi:hypothetical protein [Moraxella bovis]|uniref:Uncharacterized protein n=1 Tax=Moraxella bovis TaxID=476 RepID=A0AAQ2SYX7_MORBO|nr:hypothetical protein [Moraxella bovis]UYZ76411.1 hypothetical protein LP093_03575 [Moraxella bovis]UYZ77637.1 hypothetical protein LP115_10235 [Moraxella bovis]UYZ81853.1 hypothetical protein LP113_03730 [Moraxella bovis]UYZ86123.1 hypothetical protein LP094_10285 [Moraxella bovis]UYZ91556.1 hypothetical protein LP103_10345 [Moraxella bovis]